jgi:hypothetical protein
MKNDYIFSEQSEMQVRAALFCISANLFSVWHNGQQLDFHVCFCIPLIIGGLSWEETQVLQTHVIRKGKTLQTP